MGVPTLAEAGSQQTNKRCYRNQTAGWLGVTKLDHLGGQVGHPVKPYGTVWLTDDEAVLTARAPADAKDNPFIEQEFLFQDEKGARQGINMAPLVLAEDQDGTPDDRYVPVHGGQVAADALQGARTDAQGALLREDERPVPTTAVAPTLAPSSAAAVPPSHATRTGAPHPHIAQPPEDDLSGEEPRDSWVENSERTEEPQPGSLGGVDGAAPGATQDVSTTAPEGGSTAAQASVSAQGMPGAAEETAAVTEAGEETGAAPTPEGEAVEGEYAQHEEVGSPDAAKQTEAE